MYTTRLKNFRKMEENKISLIYSVILKKEKFTSGSCVIFLLYSLIGGGGWGGRIQHVKWSQIVVVQYLMSDPPRAR